MRRWTLARRVTTLVVLGWLLGMVALVVLVLVTTDNEEAVDDLLNRVGPARRTASDLLTTVVEEQNSARGFALSGDPARLTAYQAAVLRQEDQVSDLRELVGPDDDQVLDQVHRLVADLGAWRAQGATPLVEAVQRTGPRPSADQTYVIEQRLFAAAMASAHTLVDVTSARRDAAIGGLNGFRRLEMIALIGGALLALLAGVATLRLVRRWVIRPIERLADDARVVADGDQDHRVGIPSGPPELTHVASDVERMRSRIVNDLAVQEAAQSELRSTQAELRDQAVDLMRSNRDLEQFAYVASHDLQEPLRKVSGFCQLLQRRYSGQLDDRATQYIEFAVDGAQRMQRLISELLAFSRVGRGDRVLAEVSLADVAAESLGELETVRERAGADIVVDDLPRVRGDAALLRQLVTNLVGNAVKFRRPDVPPVVRIEAVPDELGWQISVTDNGIGIDPEYADKIFVLFQRLHGKDTHPGTGIGLALAKRIVEYHGGRIWLDTEPRQGTAIRFTLPASSPDPAPARTAPTTTAAGGTAARTAPAATAPTTTAPTTTAPATASQEAR